MSEFSVKRVILIFYQIQREIKINLVTEFICFTELWGTVELKTDLPNTALLASNFVALFFFF